MAGILLMQHAHMNGAAGSFAPRGHADFDYDEPGEVEFGLMPDGDALVSVMSDRLKYSANGRGETWEDKTHFLSSHVTLKEK
jgi:hypothetical protein